MYDAVKRMNVKIGVSKSKVVLTEENGMHNCKFNVEKLEQLDEFSAGYLRMGKGIE